jgi:hypothetical protein
VTTFAQRLGSLLLVLVFAMLAAFPVQAGNVSGNMGTVRNVKREILDLAQSYTGQGDPDLAKQRSLDALVQKLISLSPQPPVKDRLTFLEGAWKQVWGPYDYRNEKRGVDPSLGVNEIYQVVFKEGYYYNVSPDFKKGDKAKERIGFLRGEYKLDRQNESLLRVKFTNLYGVNIRPTGKPLWELPALVESDRLEGRRTILPGFVVKLFFGGGALREVYTDEDMRILYGSNGKDFSKEFIYVMTRVK